ncbi:hypothetical protein ABIB35_000303 [Arthrobacter sp. UYP6]|uniref:hypothetical protein n=1 Tax=Arthrobacter sp. UYP6 TaxID=1756378 RepID=UPI003391DC5A
MKYVLPSLTCLLGGAGLAVWIFAGNLLLGLGLTSLALVLWAVAPGLLGRIGTQSGTSGEVDPARVKHYRRQNPGATIADGIRATRK